MATQRDTIKSNLVDKYNDFLETLSKDFPQEMSAIQDYANSITELISSAASKRTRAEIAQDKIRVSNIRNHFRKNSKDLSPVTKTVFNKIFGKAIQTISGMMPYSQSTTEALAAKSGKAIYRQIESSVSTLKTLASPDNLIKTAFGYNPAISMGVDFVSDAITAQKDKIKEFKSTKTSDIASLGKLEMPDLELPEPKSEPTSGGDLGDDAEPILVRIYEKTAESVEYLKRILQVGDESVDSSEELVKLSKEKDKEDDVAEFTTKEKEFEDKVVKPQEQRDKFGKNFLKKLAGFSPFSLIESILGIVFRFLLAGAGVVALGSTIGVGIATLLFGKNNSITKKIIEFLEKMYDEQIAPFLNKNLNLDLTGNLQQDVEDKIVKKVEKIVDLIYDTILKKLLNTINPIKPFTDAIETQKQTKLSMRDMLTLSYPESAEKMFRNDQNPEFGSESAQRTAGMAIVAKEMGTGYAGKIAKMGRVGDLYFKEVNKAGTTKGLEHLAPIVPNYTTNLSETKEAVIDSVNAQKVKLPGNIEQHKKDIYEASRKTGVSMKNVAAIMMKESGGRNVIGDSGKAVGPMQLHAAAAIDAGITPEERKNISKNIMAGAEYFKQKLQEWDGDVGAALAAYNQGTGAMKFGTPEQKRRGLEYAASVMKIGQELEEKFTKIAEMQLEKSMPENMPNILNQNNAQTDNSQIVIASSGNDSSGRYIDRIQRNSEPFG
jgi:hypothetical protein